MIAITMILNGTVLGALGMASVMYAVQGKWPLAIAEAGLAGLNLGLLLHSAAQARAK